MLTGHFGLVNDASFSPDGRWVVTAGPGRAGLWETGTGRNLLLLRAHVGKVTSASFSPDGRRILTSGVDHTVRQYLCTHLRAPARPRSGQAKARLAGFQPRGG